MYCNWFQRRSFALIEFEGENVLLIFANKFTQNLIRLGGGFLGNFTLENLISVFLRICALAATFPWPSSSRSSCKMHKTRRKWSKHSAQRSKNKSFRCRTMSGTRESSWRWWAWIAPTKKNNHMRLAEKGNENELFNCYAHEWTCWADNVWKVLCGIEQQQQLTICIIVIDFFIPMILSKSFM